MINWFVKKIIEKKYLNKTIVFVSLYGSGQPYNNIQYVGKIISFKNNMKYVVIQPIIKDKWVGDIRDVNYKVTSWIIDDIQIVDDLFVIYN